MAKTRTITQDLKSAIAKAQRAGWSVNAIATRAEVPQSKLSEWLSGRRESINLETAQKLAAFFGMQLTPPSVPDAQE